MLHINVTKTALSPRKDRNATPLSTAPLSLSLSSIYEMSLLEKRIFESLKWTYIQNVIDALAPIASRGIYISIEIPAVQSGLNVD